MNNTKKNFVVSFFSVLMVFTFFSSFTPKVQAATTDNVTGYAWSSNIGWISFNCTNTSSCATSNYGVNIDSFGNMTGYAWSSNIGWIKFGGLGFPLADAKLTGTSLTGWARACSGQNNLTLNQTLPNNTCTGNGRTDGWDGLISLSRVNTSVPNYGVTVNATTGAMTGYAWGSDVIGWIQFQALYTRPVVASLILKVNGNPGYAGASSNSTTPTVVIASGQTIDLTSNGLGLNTSGIASGNWSGNRACPNSLNFVNHYFPDYSPSNPLINNTSSSILKTYSLSCVPLNSSTPLQSNVIVKVNPGTCSDGVKNQNETGIDTGGICTGGSGVPSCIDGIQNQNETGVDTGGVCASLCLMSNATNFNHTLPCTFHSGTCSDITATNYGQIGSCTYPTPTGTCFDGIQNQNETGVDTGGVCSVPSISLVPWCNGTQGILTLFHTAIPVGTSCTGPWSSIPIGPDSKNASVNSYSLTCGSISASATVPICPGGPTCANCPKPKKTPIFQEL